MKNENLFACALAVLKCRGSDEKCRLVRSMSDAWRRGVLTLSGETPPEKLLSPGRPERPELVHPSRLSRRSLYTRQGRLALMHAIAHIEFNAINLACDAVYRFRGLPPDYYDDWINVAEDEARHFELVCRYLATHGVRYGDYPAHNGLWDMAVRTSDDVVLRMALIPRVMEARGLDVTPGMIEGFRKAGDDDAVSVLNTIYEEEIGHVAAGSRWFGYVCRERGLQPAEYFCKLLDEHVCGSLQGPFNIVARREAGFQAAELEFIQD